MNTNDKKIEINIYLHKHGFVPAGYILFNMESGYAGFSYYKSYIENDYPPLNPSTLNWRDGKQKYFIVPSNNKERLDRTFWELLPNKNDWGHQVIISKHPEYSSLSMAEKLYFLGNRIVGGLNSYVSNKKLEENINNLDWLDNVRAESIELFLGNTGELQQIKGINPLISYGGVRPKCTYEDENGDFWIAKFNLPNDPYDMAIAEHIAMEMSHDCGLPTAKSKVITLSSGENVFLSKRFDRHKEERFHSLSLFSLVPGNELNKKNYFHPGNPGGFIQKLVNRYSDFENMDTLNVITKLLLDIAVNNTDNHLRNIRMILNKNNKWELAPMFDITFNPYNHNHVYNPAGLPLNELYLNNPNLIEAMSNELLVSPDLIETQMKIVKKVADKWENYCDNNNMTPQDKIKIGNAVNLGLNRKEISLDFLQKIHQNIQKIHEQQHIQDVKKHLKK